MASTGSCSSARLTVRSPKTERHKGHEQRIVPITPKLYALLQDAYDNAAEGESRVVTMSRNNLARGLIQIVKAAGVELWDDLYQSL